MIRREGQDDYRLNIGLAFPRKDGGGFNIVLQAFPLDGKIVCREIGEDDAEAVTPPCGRQEAPRTNQEQRFAIDQKLAARVPYDRERNELLRKLRAI